MGRRDRSDDPLLAATLAAACSGDNGSTSTWDVAVPNDLVDAVRERPRVHRRRRSPSSTVTDFTTLADLKHVGPVPLSVYNACTLTWICTDPPLGPTFTPTTTATASWPRRSRPSLASDGGVTLHFAERVRSAAAPRHVVVTGTVDLIVGSGITFEDQGEHELKGVPDTWRLSAVKS
jgi:hypothetical protein